MRRGRGGPKEDDLDKELAELKQTDVHRVPVQTSLGGASYALLAAVALLVSATPLCLTRVVYYMDASSDSIFLATLCAVCALLLYSAYTASADRRLRAAVSRSPPLPAPVAEAVYYALFANNLTYFAVCGTLNLYVVPYVLQAVWPLQPTFTQPYAAAAAAVLPAGLVLFAHAIRLF